MTTVRVARDPNEKFGIPGDVVPGQLMTYTITYENEGQGTAFGVYLTDELGPHFDETSLQIFGGGSYEAASRVLLWTVGDLTPKGQPGSTGVVSFTVRLKNGLASGTVITNGAIVYFPSVPEVTPTNVVVNVVQPLRAVPQTLHTPAMTPIAVKLAGNDVVGSPLTFTIVEQPLNGELTGSGANLVYTPESNFTGGDRFTFKVSNGITESRPAAVEIVVDPSSNDKVAPTVLWSDPAAGTDNARFSASPWLTDTTGSYYNPVISIQFSEAVTSTSLTTGTVQLIDSAGRQVPTAVTYNGTTYQAIITPRVALLPKSTYTVRATTGVRDASGNALATQYSSTFRTGEAVSSGRSIYLPVVLNLVAGGW